MRAPVAILGAGLIFGGGLAVGSMLSLEGPETPPAAPPERLASAGRDARVAAATEAGSSPGALDDVRRELARLATEVARLREEAAAHRAAGAAEPPGTGSGNRLVELLPGLEEGTEDPEDRRNARLGRLGVPEGARPGLAAQLDAERSRIAERFAAQMDRRAWEEYRDLKGRGWHRLTTEDHLKLQETEKRFKEIQEEVLRQWGDASAYRGLPPDQRKKVEALRGGSLGIGPDGEPRVDDTHAHGFSYAIHSE